MKKVVIGVLGVVVVGLVGLVGAVSMQPDEMRMERSRQIAASPEDVWPLVSDLRAFTTWSPWEEIDPDQVATFSDPSTGVGAWYAWEGNSDVGKGKMTITAVEEHRRVVEDLWFIEPFESKAVVTLTLTPTDGGTEVSWGFVSSMAAPMKLFTLFADMDAMLGADFQKGLDKLAPLAEQAAQARKQAEAQAAQAAEQAQADAEAP